MPISHESDRFNDVTLRNMMLLIDIPLFAFSKNLSQSLRSFRASAVIFTDPNFAALVSNFRRRFMKWRAEGMMKATWLSLPMREASSL